VRVQKRERELDHVDKRFTLMMRTWVSRRTPLHNCAPTFNSGCNNYPENSLKYIGSRPITEALAKSCKGAHQHRENHIMWYMYDAALHHKSKISETLFGKHKYNVSGRRLASSNIPYTHHPQLRLPQSNSQA